MGTWLNVAFVQSADVDRVQKELTRFVTAMERRLVRPKRRREPGRMDPMQYGEGAEVHRWGFAGFRGAPGWTVIRTAPFELLMQGTPPLLARLAERVGAPAFQYNIYDSSTRFLMEADAQGRVELSGFAYPEPNKYWNGDPSVDRLDTRFHIIDPSGVAAWAETAMPNARVTMSTSTFIPDYYSQDRKKRLELTERRTLRWLRTVRAEIQEPFSKTSEFCDWKVHPAHVIRRLAEVGDAELDADLCVEPAIELVFGGPNAEHCDNLFMDKVREAASSTSEPPDAAGE